MGLIDARYPGLSVEHLQILAGLVARERDAVVHINRPFANCGWGLGCLCCQAVLRKIDSLAGSASFGWLGFTQELGMAYTVSVDGIPLRIQPDVDEVRPMMLGEAKAIGKLNAVQGSLFDCPSGYDVLRLTTSQATGKLVSSVTLYLVNETTGKTLDRVPLYTASEKASDFDRGPEDLDTEGFYSFEEPANDRERADDGEH